MHNSNYFKDEIKAFALKLERVVVEQVSDKPYCKNYLSHLFRHKTYYLEIYADVLVKLELHSTLHRREINLVDYGAGNGLLGLFAKFCGFGKVWINDMDPDFVGASINLGRQLAIEADGFLVGDIVTVKNQASENISAIIGTDVIEHIYDLPGFMNTIRDINPQMVSVFTTGSNPENFFKVKALQKLQGKDELEGGDPNDHLLFGAEPLQPYLEMRAQIIRDYFPGLSADEISKLAEATRGLIYSHIIEAVKLYKLHNSMPLPANDTNTCNPLTGSWTERLLPLESYHGLFANAGFTTKFYPGFYNEFGKGPLNFAKKMLNKVITIMGSKISPYIVIVGFKK